MLESFDEADDAVREAWLRPGRADSSGVLAHWLTTVVARVCLDMLRMERLDPCRPQIHFTAEPNELDKCKLEMLLFAAFSQERETEAAPPARIEFPIELNG